MSLIKKAIIILTLSQLAGTALAADVFIRHNINGGDLGLSTDLPVDIQVNGDCLAQGVTFGAQLGPVTLDPGKYDVQVKLSDGACSGTTVIVDEVFVQFNENLSVVAHLSDTRTPRLSTFRNDSSDLAAHTARISLRHTADAPPVKIYLVNQRRIKGIFELSNGDFATAKLPSGHYQVYIYNLETGLTRHQVTKPLSIDIASQSNSAVYAVGSLPVGSFTVDIEPVN